MYHVFFIHSSIFGQLGYFHSLAVVNIAAISMAGRYFSCLVKRTTHFITYHPVIQSSLNSTTRKGEAKPSTKEPFEGH
jgi:hypothetical protein